MSSRRDKQKCFWYEFSPPSYPGYCPAPPSQSSGSATSYCCIGDYGLRACSPSRYGCGSCPETKSNVPQISSCRSSCGCCIPSRCWQLPGSSVIDVICCSSTSVLRGDDEGSNSGDGGSSGGDSTSCASLTSFADVAIRSLEIEAQFAVKQIIQTENGCLQVQSDSLHYRYRRY